jgi:hypothetical protein
MHAELTDPYVGPAILQEAGRGYVVQSYLAMALSIVATMAGIALGVIEWRKWRGTMDESAASSTMPVN